MCKRTVKTVQHLSDIVKQCSQLVNYIIYHTDEIVQVSSVMHVLH